MSEFKCCTLKLPRLTGDKELRVNLGTDGNILRIRHPGMIPIEINLLSCKEKGVVFPEALFHNDVAMEGQLFVPTEVEIETHKAMEDSIEERNKQ